ncbi:MAG: glycosyltransferase family 4 protein [candidate division WOR-3 bacterium]
MYPHRNQQIYGTFVKNVVDLLLENGFTILLAVKAGNSKNPLIKFYQYIKFFLISILKGLFYRYNIIYVHYIAHSAIPVLIIKFFRRKIKIVSHVHGGDILEEPFLKPITSKTLKISDIIIAPSSYFKEIIINIYKINPEKIKVFPSGGVNTSLFKPKKINRKNLLKSYTNQFVLGFVSRIERGKGWNVFLEGIKKTKEKTKESLLGVIIGDGKEVTLMQKLIRKFQLNDTIEYLGSKNYELLPLFYNCFDVFIFPTTKRESLGLVGLEAMACGVPVIGSNIGGLTTYIKNGVNGYIFQPGSPESLSERIIQYMQLNKRYKKQMKKCARLTALEYDRNKISKILLECFQ